VVVVAVPVESAGVVEVVVSVVEFDEHEASDRVAATPAIKNREDFMAKRESEKGSFGRIKRKTNTAGYCAMLNFIKRLP
jgi:hypothetical protein